MARRSSRRRSSLFVEEIIKAMLESENEGAAIVEALVGNSGHVKLDCLIQAIDDVVHP